MKRVLKRYFIPHAENNYHPHILHTKRAFFYTLVFVVMKMIVVVFVVLLPSEAYLHPDILAEQSRALLALTNDERTEKGFLPLVVQSKLTHSAGAKANDMAQRQYFSHISPAGNTLDYFLHQAGYDYTVAGENLAMGFSDVRKLVDAWIASPAHYANMVDPAYKEVGVGLESGLYRGTPTVYVVEHYGARVPAVLAAVSDDTSGVARSDQIAGTRIQKITAPASDHTQSWVYWLEQDGVTVVQARVVVTGQVGEAVIAVGQHIIPLTRVPTQVSTTTVFVGRITVPGGADQFFAPLVIPTITITSQTGQHFVDVVDWFNVKPTSPSFFDRYAIVKRFFAPLTSIFAITADVYVFFFIFFSVALVLSIGIEARRQHPHVIAQTFLFLGFLVGLWWI